MTTKDGLPVFSPDADPKNADWPKAADKTRQTANDVGLRHLERAREHAEADRFAEAAEHCNYAFNAFSIAATV